MANYKLTLDDFDSDDFELFAIHTNLKDFKLSYLLNLKIHILLAKNEKEITIKFDDEIGRFSRFSYNDVKKDITWELIKNKTDLYSNKPNTGFFTENVITKNLIPELKNVDYLLKIDNIDQNFETNFNMLSISTIPNISTVYKVDKENLKSINNLIF